MLKRKITIREGQKRKKVSCPCCGEEFWLDVERTYTEVERVYAGRVDCCI